MNPCGGGSLNFRTSFCLLLIFISSLHVHGISLDSDGYYDIVIAIDEKTAQNENEDYLDNLRAGIQDLSHAIFETTGPDCPNAKRKFSIRSADIVVPNHWNIDADAFVTTQTYQNADIRISHEYLVPQAINPTFCGYPGHYIELPYSFFDKCNEPYGPTGKALLTLWARYRWGIFEEHGYPGDSLFPYFWKSWGNWTPSEGEPEEPWKVTSCANAEIKGIYKAGSCNSTEINDAESDEECHPDYEPPENPGFSTTLEPEGPRDLYPPPSNCRFCPDIENQTATTSVMSFPYIQSLLDFCNEATHDKRAPNRQNLFCQFKSAWEVIQLSKDWKQRKEDCGNERFPINFRILKKTEKPLLFILTDGVNKPPDAVITTMTSKLSDLFEKTENWNVLASVGVFPGQNIKDSYDTIYKWNTPWYNKGEFLTAFQESFESPENFTFRDFGSALQDIGNQIKDRKHAPGAVIIMLKYGNETDEFMRYQWPALEGEAIAAIIHQNIRLFVLEGKDDQAADTSSPFRLKNIAELSGGLHFPIGNEETDVNNVNKIMSEVDTILADGSLPPSKYRVVYKATRVYEADYATAETSIIVNYVNVTGVLFYFHTSSMSYEVENVRVSNLPAGVVDFPFEDYPQWGRPDTEFQSAFANWTSPDGPLKEHSQWTCSFYCGTNKCTASIVAIVELDIDPQSEETQPSEDDYTIEVYTSAEHDGNLADLLLENVASLKAVTFSVYAKLYKNGHPINSPDMGVIAQICYHRDGYYNYLPLITCKEVVLTDNGPIAGDPDLTANDGIFSGNFIPEADGEIEFPGKYQVSVAAQISKSAKSRSLPVDQEQIRCGSGYQGCWTETVDEPFFVYADSHRRLEFVGKEEYATKEWGVATRVLDLRAEPSTQGGYNYDIVWTEPTVLNQYGRRPADSYHLQFAHSFDDVLNKVFNDTIYTVPYPIQPGNTARAGVSGLEAGEKRWYVLKSISKPEKKEEGISSLRKPQPVWSNVLFVHERRDYLETTTTTTTTTTPGPTPTTVRLPTPTGGSTTLPTRVTTTTQGTTTKSPTTTTRSTTTRVPPSETTTTTRSTTVRFEGVTEANKNHWYKSAQAVAVFSVFGVGFIGVIGGAMVYIKLITREE